MDIDYLLALQSAREAAGSGVETFFVAVSELGMPTIPILLMLFAYFCVNKRAGAFVLLASFFACFVNEFLKNLVCCYRPWIRDTRVTPAESALSGASGYSFPSGHTTRVSSALGALAWAFRRHKALVACCVVAIALVALSRNFLGCHTPQDVLAALVIGLGSVWLASRLLPWVTAAEKRDLRVLLVALGASALALAIVLGKPYPLDYDATGQLLVDPAHKMRDCFAATGAFDGVALALFLERRHVRFSDTPSIPLKLLRFVPAALLAFGANMLYAPVASILDMRASLYVVSALGMFVVLFAWPWLFVRIERALNDEHYSKAPS